VVHGKPVDKRDFLHRKNMQHKMNIVISCKIKGYRRCICGNTKKMPIFCGLHNELSTKLLWKSGFTCG
ncbi:MAG: hypothetical protein IIV62_04540, partial [Anaerotignum sp.]|nr:hypothetical protein [Anaerotignum sp.]